MLAPALFGILAEPALDGGDEVRRAHHAAHTARISGLCALAALRASHDRKISTPPPMSLQSPQQSQQLSMCNVAVVSCWYS
eukprot:4851322-Amphidinium_carterae.1